MTVHLIKLSVGSETVSGLAKWQATRLKDKKQRGQKPELMHITRNMPRRAEEVLNGGSIYWVIRGFICARQKIIELRPLLRDDTPHCGIVLDKELVRVQLRPRRAFQGWRYFEAKDAPPDIIKGKSGEDMPDDMRRELTELGLL
jgi:hypothetical protein